MASDPHAALADIYETGELALSVAEQFDESDIFDVDPTGWPGTPTTSAGSAAATSSVTGRSHVWPTTTPTRSSIRPRGCRPSRSLPTSRSQS